jgi:Family of unknown function (DUF5670)
LLKWGSRIWLIEQRFPLYFFLNHYIKKYHKMGNLLYIIAVAMIIFWAVGFFAYSAGGIIHVLLVIAGISILLRVIQGKKIV